MKSLIQSIAALVAFVLLGALASAQVWSAPAPFDTGWTRVNEAPTLAGNAEPTDWARVMAPLPDAADAIVRTRITFCDYRVIGTATNLSPVNVWVQGSGTVTTRVAHDPGLYSINGLLHLPGHTDAEAIASSVGVTGFGGGGFFYELQPGQTVTVWSHIPASTYVQTFVHPVDSRWRVANRRGAHSLFATTVGGYSWVWGWSNPGTAPANWTHNPVQYQAVTECRIMGTVEYGHFP